MTWDYRVIKHITLSGDNYYAIHEVYYNELGIASSCTQNPAYPIWYAADTNWSLKKDIEQIKKALSKPILNYEDFR